MKKTEGGGIKSFLLKQSLIIPYFTLLHLPLSPFAYLTILISLETLITLLIVN